MNHVIVQVLVSLYALHVYRERMMKAAYALLIHGTIICILPYFVITSHVSP